MTDHFRELGFPRRPLIDPEELKQRYLQKSQEIHQSDQPNDALAALNAAFQTLQNPAERLEHLLKLECGRSFSRQPGAELSELFGRIASVIQGVNAGLQQTGHSPIVKALALQKLKPLEEDLEEIEEELVRRERDGLDLLTRFDAVFDPRNEQIIATLEQIAVNLRFIDKWKSQIRERRMRIAELE